MKRKQPTLTPLQETFQRLDRVLDRLAPGTSSTLQDLSSLDRLAALADSLEKATSGRGGASDGSPAPSSAPAPAPDVDRAARLAGADRASDDRQETPEIEKPSSAASRSIRHLASPPRAPRSSERSEEQSFHSGKRRRLYPENSASEKAARLAGLPLDEPEDEPRYTGKSATAAAIVRAQREKRYPYLRGDKKGGTR